MDIDPFQDDDDDEEPQGNKSYITDLKYVIWSTEYKTCTIANMEND